MNIAEELVKLQELRRSGDISEVEYNQAKAAVIGGRGSPSVKPESGVGVSANLVFPGVWVLATIEIGAYWDGRRLLTSTTKQGFNHQFETSVGKHTLGIAVNKGDMLFAGPYELVNELTFSRGGTYQVRLLAPSPLIWGGGGVPKSVEVVFLGG